MATLRQKILQEIANNPLITAKKVCENVNIPYSKYRQYVWNLKTNYKNEQGSNRSFSFHAVRFYGFALKSIDRSIALEKGWVLSKSKNRRFIFKCSLGRMDWFENGRIVVWIRKPVSEARLFQIICYGFSYTGLIDEALLDAFLHSFKYKGAHLVQNVGQPLPYVRNDLLKDPLGVIVKLGDRSHPKGLELEFCLPKWAEDFRILTEQNIKTVESFNGFMRDIATPKGLDKKTDYIS